ncbi:MAG: hypothetical protein JW841_09350 [Deltaproteobacteria bacterium]|nr:hypothetical protein [Deltaproteobacteria bacterium]
MQATLISAKPNRELNTPNLSVKPLPITKPDTSRVAVILNRNARRVNDKLARRIKEIVGGDNLFYSRTLEDAEAYAREIVRRGYGTVVCGGGDGTLARSVNLIHHYIAQANAWRADRYQRLGQWQTLITNPDFGFLRLGTGNALGSLVGASDPIQDLEFITTQQSRSRRSVSMIDVEGERCFFTGLGYDSLVLNDYNWMCRRISNPLTRPLMESVWGYFAAVLGRTIPNVLWHQASNLTAKIVTLGEAFYVDPDNNDALEPIAPGTILFEGSAAMIGAGTTPFYGYGFKVYPFSELKSDMMNLRVAQIGPMQVLSNLNSIWKGNYRNSNKLLDFIVSDVSIELEQPFPLQLSGDAHGIRKNLRWRIAPDKLHLLDLHRTNMYS